MWKRIQQFIYVTGRLMSVFYQMLKGAWVVSALKSPVVTIFGGSQFSRSDPYMQTAHKLAQMLVDQNISVITGGGGGIMEAASCGAYPSKGGPAKSISIGVEGVEDPNPCVQEFFMTQYFFARKWLMTRFADAFVIFPGGFGTMDELSEILLLLQTKKMQKAPLILIGTEYWQPWVMWLKTQMLERHHLIQEEDLKLFTIVDTLEEAACLIKDSCGGKG